MESVGSSSSTSDHRLHFHIRPTQPLAGRIFRALRHHLRLLHRSESNFFILGATGNVYTVTLANTPSCTCPDRTTPCKHIFFVLIRVLGVSVDDTCLRRRTLRPCRLNRLLSTPTSPDSLASLTVRQWFHQLFFEARRQNGASRGDEKLEIEEGTACPICLDEMEKGDRVVACGTCKNIVHERCLMKWRRSRGRRGTICVICRARWRGRNNDQDGYLNLAAYGGEDDMAAESAAGLCAG
ncbi:hypothetical protein JCGZ_07728 [Jatropha curcas]|uniref:SWIM-type domain-containing protein n=2 Tax=Jatropha curcas TaxID=180498 RepID=A0A067KDF7_JATCU|nr:hypothetical protein JCGZ_07728 [Jatropha curcas]